MCQHCPGATSAGFCDDLIPERPQPAPGYLAAEAAEARRQAYEDARMDEAEARHSRGEA